MTAIAGGLGAAVCFAAATVCSSRSSRMIGATSAVAWVMLVGLLVAGPAVLVAGVPPRLDAAGLGWLAVAGAGNVVGLVISYRALRIGKVSIVAPIVSTEGAVAALIAVARGEPVRAATGATLAVIAAGVVLAGIVGSDDQQDSEHRDRQAVVYALAAAAAFGFSLYATGRVSASLSVAWAILPARLVGVVAVFLPLALTSRLRLTRSAVPLVVIAGLCEVGGFASFALGARHGIAVSSVLASQFAALAAIAGWILFREGLTRARIVGVAAIAAGVAALSALQA